MREIEKGAPDNVVSVTNGKAGNEVKCLLADAVLEESDNRKVWVPWWLSPSGATVDDLEGYVMVDVEFRKLEVIEGGSEKQKEL